MIKNKMGFIFITFLLNFSSISLLFGQIKISLPKQVTVAGSLKSQSFSSFSVIGQSSAIGRTSSVNYSLYSGEGSKTSSELLAVLIQDNLIDFGFVEITESKSIYSKIFNNSNADVKITSIISSNSLFSTSISDSLINSKDSSDIKITFSAQSTADLAENLEINIFSLKNNSISKTINLNLFAKGFIYPESIEVNNQITFGNIEDKNSYRFIGLPGNNSIPLGKIIQGAPGKGNDWRAFHDSGIGELSEFDNSSIFSFKPGNGFIILSKNQINIAESVYSVEINKDNCYSIPLHEEWNIISNPFDKPISWNSIQELNGSQQTLYEYNNETGRYDPANELALYSAYYFMNGGDNLESLIIPYFPNSSTLPKRVKNSNDISISLVHKNEEKGIVKFHYSDSSSIGSDPSDIYAPPSSLLNYAIRIYNEKLETNYKYLSKDVRPFDNDTLTYDLKVRVPIGNKYELEAITKEKYSEKEIWLYDKELQKLYNMKERNVFRSIKKEKLYRVLIGSEDFIEGYREEIIPKSYALYQNYPNPFNPSTVIRYSLPKESRVSIKVYNTIGELVKTLLNNEVVVEGNHELLFSSKDLPSGIYFIRMTSEDYAGVKKAVLIK